MSVVACYKDMPSVVHVSLSQTLFYGYNSSFYLNNELELLAVVNDTKKGVFVQVKKSSRSIQKSIEKSRTKAAK